MSNGISQRARTEVIAALHQRYQSATKREKTRILDTFVAVAPCHRKHAVRLLSSGDKAPKPNVPVAGRRVYDEAVREALIIAWEAADRICGKRLKAILPSLVEAMERHGHLALDPRIRERVLSASAVTIDRILAPVRNEAGRRKRRRVKKKMSHQVPTRTFAEWDQPPPGDLEIDFVAHGGGSVSGRFIHSLVATDVCSGWTEAIPLLAREQSLVVAGLEAIALLHRIRDAQAALAELADPRRAIGSRHEGLEQFLARRPELGRSGEVRPTHAQHSAKPRIGRTRKDPFEGVWSEVLLW